MGRYRVVFMGTPELCLPLLHFFYEDERIVLEEIVTMPDRKSGRGQKTKAPSVASFAKKKDIRLFQTADIKNEQAWLEGLASDPPDWIVVFAFAQFLPQSLLNIPKKCCLNLHTSLLPKYRGAAPIHYALMNGDKETGVSLQRMVLKMDAGAVCKSKSIFISKLYDFETLSEKLALLCVEVFDSYLRDVEEGQDSFTPQDEALVSFAPLLKKEDGNLNFYQQKAIDIHNRVRALSQWPGCRLKMNGEDLKVYQTVFSKSSLAPGEIMTDNGELHIGTKEGALRITRLQRPNRKVISDTELLRTKSVERFL